MPIIRMTRQQIEEAAKAREVALQEDEAYRGFAERREHEKQEAIDAMRKERSS